MIYGYCRVSTKGQERDGNSLTDQQAQIKARYESAEIVCEAYSGAKERPIFEGLIEKCGEGDMLVVCKLDRFARSVQHGLAYIQRLMDKGVKIHILNMGLIEDTPMGRLIVTNLLAFAEFERATILERTQAGKEVARANNPDYREGRKALDVDAEMLELVRKGEMTKAEMSRRTGISANTIRRRLKASA